MNTIQIIVIACILAAIGLISLWWGTKTAHDLDQEEDVYVRPKFQPRKVTDLSTPSSIPPIKEDVTPISTEKAIAPKRRHYKKNYKKKPTNAKNAQVDKKPVGRPRKSE